MAAAARTDIESVPCELFITLAIIGGRGRRCWRLYDKKLSYEIEFVDAVAVGEKAVMADTVKTIWQGVQEKTADELVGR